MQFGSDIFRSLIDVKGERVIRFDKVELQFHCCIFIRKITIKKYYFIYVF